MTLDGRRKLRIDVDGCGRDGVGADFTARKGGFRVKALVKSRAERGLWLEDVPEPTIGINDVKIRVLKTGICGTDLHIYEWDAWASANVPVGLTIGHEFVGEIVEVGGAGG